jgi:mono/diheme cytochrome c family protein
MSVQLPTVAALTLLALTLAKSPATPAQTAPPSQPTPGASVHEGVILPGAIPRRPIDGSTPEAEQARKGQYLAAVGDCMSCHLRPGGEPLAGGLGLNTPFGTIYTSNITSDQATGIGSWTPDQFYQAMHEGKSKDGSNLYPAFPYPWFHLASREDDDALLAFLKTTPAVHYTPPENTLHFPMSIRASVKAWNLLYLNSGAFQTDPGQSAEWNRGAYIVTGLGHCGGCHTPKNGLGADRSKELLEGGTLDNWVAPDLTSNERTGLGAWSVEDITEYLQHGRNARAAAGGAMADVITYSTSLMNDADRHAIAVYLKSRAASSASAAVAAIPGESTMQRGAAIYSDVCASCHLENGVGQPRYFPPLGHNAVIQQSDPSTLEHLILAGTRIGVSDKRPSALTMPSFAWKLSDNEIADVSTYIRNSWGNQAPAVPADAVTAMRKRLGLEHPRLTVNSGDHL